MKDTWTKLLSLSVVLVLVSCAQESHFHEDKVFAGGVVASAMKLNKGRAIYQEYCMACHGVDGEGNGPASKGLYPPPRNFTQGIYKFGMVVSGELPNDEDFMKILEKGLHGTAMLPWDMSHDQMDAVIQYIKTFAPKTWEGKDKMPGVKLIPTTDPFGLARKSAAIELGKKIYHTEASCQTCHRAYVSHEELSRLNVEAGSGPITDFDPELYTVKVQDSEYGYATLPPEFTWNTVRSAQTVEEIYMRLLAGVGGTTMPSWKDTITDEQIWAVAYYVRSLMDMKDQFEVRKAFMDKIKEANR